jgi:hypothetical protein
MYLESMALVLFVLSNCLSIRVGCEKSVNETTVVSSSCILSRGFMVSANFYNALIVFLEAMAPLLESAD